jgi:hypothetical protein
MPGKRVQFDDETWQAVDLLARDRMMAFQELAEEAFRDLLRRRLGSLRSRECGDPLGPLSMFARTSARRLSCSPVSRRVPALHSSKVRGFTARIDLGAASVVSCGPVLRRFG